MKQSGNEYNLFYTMVVGLAAWIVPGAGHVILKEWTRAILIFAGVVTLFVLGLYIGSIGVVDPVGASLWYVGQMLTSPLVKILGYINVPAGGVMPYSSHGKPYEIGQIYTSIAGALNLLCIVNAMYMAYSGKQQPESADAHV